MKNRISFRTLEIVAVTLAVTAMAAGVIYWQIYGTKSPEITSKWLQSGGIASVMAQLPDPKVTPKEFATSTDEIAARNDGEEIVSLRTETAQVFKAKNGELNAKIYTAPINYLDKASATYKPIDTSTHQIADIAKANPEKQFDEYIDAGVYQATWFKDKPWDYKMFVGDSWIQYKALFEESEVLSIKVDTLKTGLKETITLKDSTAPTKLQWTVTQSTGKSAIITPPPTAVDANGKEVNVISYQIRDTLTYEVDTTNAVFPIEVDPTSVIATNDSNINSSNSVYVTARDAISGTVYNGGNFIGQVVNATPTYQVYRSFFSFAIPDMATLTAASLFLYGAGDTSVVDFYILVHTSTYSTPITGGDFDLFDGHQASGQYNGAIQNTLWNSSAYSATWNEIVFNATGLSTILAAKNTTLKVALISYEDYLNSAPTADNYEYVSFYTSATAGKEPYLSITYTLPPTVTTQSASSVTQTTAVLNGNITAVGSPAPTVRGFAWGTNSGLSGGDTATTTWDTGTFGTGAFTDTTLTFVCNTTYYSRAYATNTSGTGLGAISASFTTVACIPTVTTQSASSVGITTATLNGNITATGGANATVRGFAWGTNSALSGGDTATTTDTTGQPFGTGAFSTTTIAFVCNTTYYSRAYATNTGGTGLGAISSSFTTSHCLAPTVTTQAVSSIASTTATGNGNVTADNGAAITERGVVVSTTANPTTANDKFTSAGTTGAFTASITGRTAGKLYYVRAFATNSVGTSYGSEVTFTTTVPAGPTSITATNDGRIYTSTQATYTLARDATTGTNYAATLPSIGQFYSPTAYDVYRAFLSFAIPDMATVTSASLFLNGASDSSTTDFDIYFHTSTYTGFANGNDFDLFDGHQASGAYNGTILNNTWNTSSYSANWNEFVFNADGLAAILTKKNTTFKIAGISKEDYIDSAPTGAEFVIFRGSDTAGEEPYLLITYTGTATAPTVTTQDPTNRAVTSATANGNITSIGTAAVTVRGFKYGLTQADTWDVNETGSFGTGAFSLSITGLTKGTNYYMRAYATNSVGTVYGAYVPLTTDLQSDAVIFRNNTILNNNVILK